MPRLTFRRLRRLSNWPFLLSCLAIAALVPPCTALRARHEAPLSAPPTAPAMLTPTPSSPPPTPPKPPYQSSLQAFERVLASYPTSPWRFPDAKILRQNAGHSVPRFWRDSVSILRTQTLQSAYAPPANLKWVYVRVRKDAAEALSHNYAYSAWTAHGARLYAKVYAYRHYVLVDPPSVPHAASLQALLRAHPPDAEGRGTRLAPDQKTAAMLRAVWGQCIGAALLPFSGPSERMPDVWAGTRRLSIGQPLVGEGLDAAWYGLDTDGCVVAVHAEFANLRGKLMDRVWGGPAAAPAVRPLNPTLIRYIDTRRWRHRNEQDGETNTPGRGAYCQIKIAATDAMMRSGWWWMDVPLRLRRAQLFEVLGVGGRVTNEEWQACEFADLTTTALHATNRGFSAWEGIYARNPASIPVSAVVQARRDHARFAEAYARIKVPRNAEALHAWVCRVLRQEDELWRIYGKRWRELRATKATSARYLAAFRELDHQLGRDSETGPGLTSLRGRISYSLTWYCKRIAGSDPPSYDS